MIESVINGRGHVYRQVSDEITAAWGGAQLVAGPVLGLSYLENVAVNTAWSYESRYSHLRPVEMTVNARLDSEIRSRGIYRVPVYSVLLSIQGRFHHRGAGRGRGL